MKSEEPWKSTIAFSDDFLTERTYQERWVLLGLCAVVITMLKLVSGPFKIALFSFEFSETDTRKTAIAATIAIVYFLVSFLVHGISDRERWRQNKTLARLGDARNRLWEEVRMQNERIALSSTLKTLSPEDLKREGNSRAEKIRKYLDEKREAKEEGKGVGVLLPANFYRTWLWIRTVVDLVLPVLLAALTIAFVIGHLI